jgi:hypothetical protein
MIPTWFHSDAIIVHSEEALLKSISATELSVCLKLIVVGCISATSLIFFIISWEIVGFFFFFFFFFLIV